jgi:hypothetical protein
VIPLLSGVQGFLFITLVTEGKRVIPLLSGVQEVLIYYIGHGGQQSDSLFRSWTQWYFVLLLSRKTTVHKGKGGRTILFVRDSRFHNNTDVLKIEAEFMNVQFH